MLRSTFLDCNSLDLINQGILFNSLKSTEWDSGPKGSLMLPLCPAPNIHPTPFFYEAFGKENMGHS